MAGDVDVFMYNNDLYIRGDDAHNRVDVGTVDGQIRVTGTNWQGATSINNGFQPFEIDASAVDDIWIEMRGGDDRVIVNNVHLNNTSHGRMDIETDQGNDLVMVTNSSAQDLVLETGTGNDHAIVSYSAVTRDIFTDLGSGDDELDLYAVYAADDIRVFGGTGHDDVAIQGATAVDDLYADLGDGNDIMWVNGGQFEDLTVDADKGNDRVTLQGVTVTDDLDVEMEEGDDQLYIYNSNVYGRKSLHGGSGADKLGASGNNFNAYAYDSSF